MYKNVLAKNLRIARIKKSYTQQYVADYLLTSQSNIAKYEKGTLEPNVETIGLLAELYEVSIDWLFGKEN